MRCDCTGDPPGELMQMATDGALESVKAFSMAAAAVAIDKPGRKGVAMPIGPEKRSTGTTGLRENNPIVNVRFRIILVQVCQIMSSAMWR